MIWNIDGVDQDQNKSVSCSIFFFFFFSHCRTYPVYSVIPALAMLLESLSAGLFLLDFCVFPSLLFFLVYSVDVVSPLTMACSFHHILPVHSVILALVMLLESLPGGLFLLDFLLSSFYRSGLSTHDAEFISPHPELLRPSMCPHYLFWLRCL